MATTTNYGWTTPDDTALVKDGAAAIRSLGSSIDSTLKTQIDAQIPDSIIDAKGDLIVGTADNSPAKLSSSGVNGQVLKVDTSTASGLAWGSAPSGIIKEEVFNASNASWTIPSGVTQIWALCVGGGGGGGASSTATASNSGGGGGAGQVIEKWITLAGDTTLNITVGAGGAGATTQGAKGSSGSASTIVGNTSATTYLSAAGGGGGGGGAAANVAGISGASGGGAGTSTSQYSGAGGGFIMSAMEEPIGFYNSAGLTIRTGQGAAPTTVAITGTYGGSTANYHGGQGITTWGRNLGGGGNGSGASAGANGMGRLYGGATFPGLNQNGTAGTANTGGGGSGAGTTTTTKYNGGDGGSGLVVIRYVGA